MTDDRGAEQAADGRRLMAATEQAAPVRPTDEEYITVRVRRLDAQALVLGSLDYAVEVSRGGVATGGSPMRLRAALRAALEEGNA